MILRMSHPLRTAIDAQTLHLVQQLADARKAIEDLQADNAACEAAMTNALTQVIESSRTIERLNMERDYARAEAGARLKECDIWRSNSKAMADEMAELRAMAQRATRGTDLERQISASILVARLVRPPEPTCACGQPAREEGTVCFTCHQEALS